MSGSRLDLNVTLAAKEAEAVPLGRDEKAALKRAEGLSGPPGATSQTPCSTGSRKNSGDRSVRYGKQLVEQFPYLRPREPKHCQSIRVCRRGPWPGREGRPQAGRGGRAGFPGLQGLRAGHLLESAETAISQKIANEQGAELHRSAPCLCVTPVRRPLCGR